MRRFLTLLLAVLFCLCAVSCRPKERTDVFRLYFLDVGQGDSILLRTLEGDVLIDAGTEDAQELLCLRLEQLGVRELTLAIFTHPDEDHIGGADGVLNRFPVQQIWCNGARPDHESADRLFSLAQEKNIPVCAVMAGDRFDVGGVIISVLTPLGDIGDGGNEASVSIKLHYGEFDAILTGDAGQEEERKMVDAYGTSQLSCDLYKVGHHGSNTSSGSLFLQTLHPTYAVISCGGGNSYGHPMGEVLARLEASGATILRTDLCGEIVFETDGQELWLVSD